MKIFHHKKQEEVKLWKYNENSNYIVYKYVEYVKLYKYMHIYRLYIIPKAFKQSL